MSVASGSQHDLRPGDGERSRAGLVDTQLLLPTPETLVILRHDQDSGTGFLTRMPRIASLTFGVCSALWILGSDVVVELLADDPMQLAKIQTLKGFAFIIVSALLLYVLLRQVTRRTLSQQARAQQNSERLSIALAATRSGVWEWHIPTRTFHMSADMTDLIGARADSIGTWADLAARIHPDDRSIFGNVVKNCMQQPDVEHSSQYRIVRDDGSAAWFEARGRLLADDQGQPMRVVGVLTDITRTKEMDRHIERLTYYDTLTGLPNRAQFMRLLEGRIEQRRASNSVLLVARLDINRFQDINSMLGTQAGDEVLAILGHRLEDACPPSSLAARFAGDDFAVAISSIESLEAAQELAEELVQTLNVPIELRGETLSLSIALGASVAPNDGDDAETLISNAELAMVRARRDGAPLGFYETGMNEAFRERAFMEQELRAALRDGGLSLVYQPIVKASDHSLVGFEALARWSHPKLGVVPPSVFIPLAEATDLIGELGRFVLHTACAQAAAWNSTLRRQLRMAVNVSPRQMESDSFVDEVDRVLTETGLAADCLELEVTESLIMQNPQAISDRLRRLRALGVHVAIDDFGTGYSSLAVLRHLPVSKLKIDRSFVQDLGNDQGGDAIIAAILELAQSLGLAVTAEGVETSDQLEILRHHQCETVQGYLIGRPLPPDALVPFISNTAVAATAR